MNFAILSFIIGFILQFEALFLLLPWIVGMIYGEYHVALIYLVLVMIFTWLLAKFERRLAQSDRR